MRGFVSCLAALLVLAFGGFEVRCYAGTLLGGDHTNKNLLEIDPQSGQGTVIGNLGFEVNGLAYDSRRDIVYGCSKSDLYRIDPETATAQHVGPFGGELMHTIEYDSIHDVLYGILSEDTPWRLVTIDVATGLATTTALVSQNGLIGSAFDPSTGTMYVSNIYGDCLQTIDLTTGGLQLVGDFGAGIQVGVGMAFHPQLGILATDNRNSHNRGDDLYRVDKYTGAATYVGEIQDLGAVGALVYIPEPSTMALLFTGAVGLLAYAHRRRRRR